MNIETIKSKVPDYAKDIRLNLSTLLGGVENVPLDNLQRAGLALVAAYATREKIAIQWFESFARDQGLSEAAINAVKSAATIMAMNNVYYRSVHSIQAEHYKKLPAQLRMQALKNHGIDHHDFELYCVVASAINGCGHCLNAHVVALSQSEKIEPAHIHYGLRLASVIQGLVQVIHIEYASASAS